MSEKNNAEKPAFLRVGTQQCALACAALGAVIAILFLTIGFWKTLFIALFILAGLFTGGVKDKDEFLRAMTEKFLSRREVKVYQAQSKAAPDTGDGLEEEYGEADEEEAAEEEDEEDAGEEDAEEEETEEEVSGNEDAEEGKADGGRTETKGETERDA